MSASDSQSQNTPPQHCSLKIWMLCDASGLHLGNFLQFPAADVVFAGVKIGAVATGTPVHGLQPPGVIPWCCCSLICRHIHLHSVGVAILFFWASWMKLVGFACVAHDEYPESTLVNSSPAQEKKIVFRSYDVTRGTRQLTAQSTHCSVNSLLSW